ncbi:MAG: hypothetical protein J5613_05025 [Alphaproteobacteria bacterium]|nr:hypothetical protein [Alphaproteobacteria bacterium]
MVKCKELFNIKNLLRVIAVVAVCTMSAGAYAYSGGDDDDDYNDCQYFSPAYALCTVHSYNAGMAKNPTDASQIAEMNRVIALKSTVIAQQMKQQYDVLNAMVKRFKTQLEKAVLTSKMEVLTGNTSGSSSSDSSSSANNDGLANADDCYAVRDQADVYDCLAKNLTKINQAVEKDTANARKQLKHDMEIMSSYLIDYDKTTCPDNISVKNAIKKCVQHLQIKVRIAKQDFETKNAQARRYRDY